MSDIRLESHLHLADSSKSHLHLEGAGEHFRRLGSRKDPSEDRAPADVRFHYLETFSSQRLIQQGARLFPEVIHELRPG